MRFTVLVCERITGIVCYPYGRRYLITDGPRIAPRFLSLDEAKGWCRELRTTRSNLECWVHDEAGQQVEVFR